MKELKFLRKTEDIILTAMVKEINQLFGLNKAEHLAIKLFTKLPVNFIVEQSDSVSSQKKLSLEELDSCFTSTVFQGNESTIQFIFLYKDEKHLKHIHRVAEKYSTYFAYHYIKQLQHLLRNHYTATHQGFMLRHTNEGSPFSVIKLVYDYVVNASLKDMFDHSELKNSWSKLEPLLKYNENYTTELHTLKQIASQGNKYVSTPISPSVSEITINETKYLVPTAVCSSLTTDDNGQANLAQALYSTIRSESKGSGGNGIQIMMQCFESVKTDVEWFTKLKTSFEKKVYHATHHYDENWQQLDDNYRHLFNSPTPEYSETKIRLILSVDQSGSMSTQDLQKLLYLIEENAQYITECLVIVHTGEVDKVFKLEDEYDITKHPDFKFLQARLTNGGTSHRPVFHYIQELEIDKPQDYIYLSLSDNYSDIEESIKDYPIMRELPKYWLSPANSRHVSELEAGGINITMN